MVETNIAVQRVICDIACRDLLDVHWRALTSAEPIWHNVETLLDSREVSSLAAAHTLLLAPRLSSGMPCELALQPLRERFPHSCLYVATDSKMRTPSRAYAWEGADGLFALDKIRELRDLVRRVVRRDLAPAPEVKIRRVLGSASTVRPAVTLALHAVRNAPFRLGWKATGQWFGIDRKTARQMLSRANLPGFRDLVAVGFLWHDETLKTFGIRSAEERAARLGLASAYSLRRTRSRLLARSLEEPEGLAIRRLVEL